MLALDRGGGQLRLDRGELARQRGSPLGGLLRLGPRHLVHLGRPVERGGDLLLGSLQRLEGALGGGAPLLGLLRLPAQAIALLRGVLPELGQLGLELGDPHRAGGLVGLLVEGVEAKLPLTEGAAQIALGHLEGLGARADALGGRPGLGQDLALAATPLLTGRDPLLDRRAARAHLLEALLDGLPRRSYLRELRLGRGELFLLRAQVVGDDPRAKLVRLAQELGRALRRLGLPLQRPEARAGLPLHVHRPLQVVARAVQLELGAVTALAVLAEAGRLLDQQAPVAGLRADDRLDLALADHGVGLPAHVRVR